MADDLYGKLGVSKTADTDTIKKTYRKLAKELHPDRHPGDKNAEAKFKAINHAFNVLSDPKKRKLYDEFGEDGLREGFEPDRARQYQAWAGQGVRGGGNPNLEDILNQGGFQKGGGGDFGNLFGDLFGGRGRGGRARGPVKGQDVESEVTVDFLSAARGATLDLRRDGGASVSVRIPAGAAEGSRLRIQGQGSPSPQGGPPGDLIVTVHVSSHPIFRREGDDLHIDVPVTVSEAYLGAKAKVPTLDGSVVVKVPERTQSGTKLRVRGKGVQRKGKTAGDLYVHFQIRIPTSAEAARAIEELAKYETEDLRANLTV